MAEAVVGRSAVGVGAYWTYFQGHKEVYGAQQTMRRAQAQAHIIGSIQYFRASLWRIYAVGAGCILLGVKS